MHLCARCISAHPHTHALVFRAVGSVPSGFKNEFNVPALPSDQPGGLRRGTGWSPLIDVCMRLFWGVSTIDPDSLRSLVVAEWTGVLCCVPVSPNCGNTTLTPFVRAKPTYTHTYAHTHTHTRTRTHTRTHSGHCEGFPTTHPSMAAAPHRGSCIDLMVHCMHSRVHTHSF